jgi:signal transduction histidine kinase
MDQLLSNAIKYSNKGEVTITLNEKNQLIIRDTGIGIDPSDLPRIFEKGFTGINGRFDKKSSGLGLSITKMICDKLNMQIQIESELGRGTQVILQVSPYSHVRLQSKM